MHSVAEMPERILLRLSNSMGMEALILQILQLT